MARKVITKTYCLLPGLIKWLEGLAKKKHRSVSSVLTEILLEAKTADKHKSQ